MNASKLKGMASVVRRLPGHFVAMLFVCSAAALIEGLGVGLLLPLIDSSSDQLALQDIPIIGTLSPYFAGLSAAQRVQAVAIGLAIVGVARGVISYLRGFGTRLFEVRIMTRLEGDAYRQYNRLCLSHIQEHDLATYSNFITSFPAEAAAVAGQLIIAMSVLLNFTVYGIFLLSISWVLTVAMVATLAIISVAINFGLFPKIREAGRKVNEAAIVMNQWFFETARSLVLIRGIGKQTASNERFANCLDSYRKNSVREAALKYAVDPALSTTALLLLACGLFFGAAYLFNTEADISKAVLFIIILSRLLPMLTIVNEARGGIAARSHMLARLLEYLNTSDKAFSPEGNKTLDSLEGDITFSHVGFKYPGFSAQALSGIDLTIPQNKMTAFVGPSGSGKSTMVRLLLRLYAPTSGEIDIAGKNIQQFTTTSWNGQLAYVPQEPLLFDDTIINNLLFANPIATQDEIIAACKTANAHEFIEELEQGYNTVIGDNGVKLSGGQKQRLAIARALVSKPKLLILDEATSNLDTVSERRIQDAVEQLQGTMTIVAIAHRLSTIQQADQIVVMEDGAIHRVGTHDELLRGQGLYQELVKLQQLEAINGTSGNMEDSEEKTPRTRPAPDFAAV